MTRDEKINLLSAEAAKLEEDQLSDVLAMVQHINASRSVYSTLTDDQKAEIDSGLAELDRGEGIPHEDVMARINATLAKHGV